MAIAAPVAPNPAVLVWARRESGYAPERVAKRRGVKEERLGEWEGGEKVPTMRQAGAGARQFAENQRYASLGTWQIAPKRRNFQICFIIHLNTKDLKSADGGGILVGLDEERGGSIFC